MILSVDIGSTGVRAVLVNSDFQIVRSSYQRIVQTFPEDGWIEHDLNDIWSSCLQVLHKVYSGKEKKRPPISAIGVTTQRSSLAVWRREDGDPFLPCISWADRRTGELCSRFKQKDDSDHFLAFSGRSLSTSNLGLKLRWIRDSNDEIYEKLKTGVALWGTLDTWFVWQLTNGKTWATDYSNASTTGIYDIVNLKWSEELMNTLAISDIPCPEVRPTIADYGNLRKDILGKPFPIASVSGDQYASLFAQGCVHSGMGKCTLGTGGFFLVNVGQRPGTIQKGIASRICWDLGDGPVYALEGMVFHVGTLIEWVSHSLGFVDKVEQCSELAQHVESNGVYIVPAFSGLASPYWDPNAKAIIAGLSLDTGPKEIVRAALEAVAFQVKDMVEAMKMTISLKRLHLRVDGNVANNNTLMQIIADQVQIPVDRSAESGYRSAFGAALFSGIQRGIWSGIDDIGSLWRSEYTFYPRQHSRVGQTRYAGWQETVRRARGLSLKLNNTHN